MTTVKGKHVKKYENLVKKHTKAGGDPNNITAVDKIRWIMNLSLKELSDNQKNLLSKGMNFTITPK